MSNPSDTEIKDYRIALDFKLRSPVISSSTEAARLGIDASPWTIEKNGLKFPALPGSLIKGNLLHSLYKLRDIDPNWVSQKEIFHWFGEKAGSDNNTPNRALLRNSDVWLADKPQTDEHVHYRIKINSQGAVDHGALQQVEAPHPVGESIIYSGWFEFSCTEQEAKKIHAVISKAACFIPALGAYKGIGFGVILDANINEVEVIQEKPLTEVCLSASNHFGIKLDFDRPLCINGLLKQAGNRFESLEWLPGGVIKGAVATRMKQLGGEARWPDLFLHLDKIRFSHATPAPKQGEQKREVLAPLNLYHCHDGAEGKDGFGLVSPDTSLPPMGNIRFQVDWKDKEWSQVNECLKPLKIANDKKEIASLARTLRVRTKIQKGTYIADEKQLFALEAIEPSEHSWLCNVSLPDGFDQETSQSIYQQLLALLGTGLNSIGKLDACTTSIECNSDYWPSTVASVDSKNENSTLCIMLLSDARLFKEEDLKLGSTNSGQSLHEHYALSWFELSGGILELDSFYAQQALYGGEYYRHRFGDLEEAYNPWVVTKAGSVFYFNTSDSDKCTELLKQWKITGLPVHPSLPDDWRKNPLLPENGYGEILVNPAFPMAQLGEVKT